MDTPVHAVVVNGTVTQLILMDTATAQIFRDYGFVAMMWGFGAQLIDVTNAAPQPAIGWGHDGQNFVDPFQEDVPVDEEIPVDEEPVIDTDTNNTEHLPVSV